MENYQTPVADWANTDWGCQIHANSTTNRTKYTQFDLFDRKIYQKAQRRKNKNQKLKMKTNENERTTNEKRKPTIERKFFDQLIAKYNLKILLKFPAAQEDPFTRFSPRKVLFTFVSAGLSFSIFFFRVHFPVSTQALLPLFSPV